jgi:repressor LexA
MKTQNNIGERIRQAIKEAGLTQQKLADKLGITNPVINVWVTGKRIPTVDSIKKIAQATNKPYSFFVEEREDEFVKGFKAIPLTPNNTIQLPILADVPAGLPEFSDRDVEMFVDIPRFLFPGADFIVRCIGDSLEPKINKGDFCVIRKMTEPLDGRAMMIKTENGVCMKVIKKEHDKVYLCSTNPKYQPFTSKDLTIIGLIIGHWSRDDREHWE